MTLPEVLLWQALRRRQSGHRFRRQCPAGPYILDFFCAPAKLAIEVDGEVHGDERVAARDALRDSWLRSQGIRVMRIPAHNILADFEAVVRLIEAEAGRE